MLLGSYADHGVDSIGNGEYLVLVAVFPLARPFGGLNDVLLVVALAVVQSCIVYGAPQERKNEHMQHIVHFWNKQALAVHVC